MAQYHPGKVIRKYRELKGWSQQKLAEHWPKTDGEVGVTWHYVQKVEYSKRNIVDQPVLRKISELLDIPLWEFGLSEYDPWKPHSIPGAGKRLYSETLDAVEALINQTFAMRRYAPLPEVERSAQAITNLFDYFRTYTPPSSKLEPRFLKLYAQEQNIRGLMFFENAQYDKALLTFEDMYKTAEQVRDPVLMIHALQKWGVELKRAERFLDAINALEQARDYSFSTSKPVMAFANAYLAHIYAADKDLGRFERTINAAINIAEPLKEAYGDGIDFIHHKFSGILQLRSRGYLRLNQPKKVLDLHDELQRHISADGNIWLDHRLHLYRGRAFLMLKDIEACIGAGRKLFQEVKDWKSPHRTGRAYELLEAVENAGYGELQVVKDFKEELRKSGASIER
jgi:tetratricopeptide (TPR) repeat protein